MTTQQPLRLQLKGAPLIMAVAAWQSGISTQISWQKSAEMTEFDFKLPQKLADQLQWIIKTHNTLVKSEKKRVYAPHILPYIAKVDLELVGHQENLGLFAALLEQMPLIYARTVGESLKNEIGRGAQLLNAKPASGSLISDRNPMRIIKAIPANELELGFNGYYRQSGMNWAQSYAGWLDLKYEEKVTLLKHQWPLAAGELLYEIEVVCEPQLLVSLSDSMAWQLHTIQPPVPSHGYELPESGDGGMMQRCFDTSFELVAWAQKRQPAAEHLFSLWGHRQRALVKVDAQNFSNIFESKSQISKLLLAKLAEKHPIIWSELGQSGPKKKKEEERSPAGPGAKGRPGNHP